jgi:acylphosphatase
MKVRLHAFVFGLVQGVFFRANTRDKAIELGLAGWVRNVRDGSVEIVAEGEKETLEKLLDWCSHGPISASVSKLEHEWLDNKDEFQDFRIRYD